MSDDEEEERTGLPVAPEDVPYLGEYVGERNEKGERHGNGRALLPNMDSYEGMYKKNKRHGYGLYIFQSTGARYFGDWVKNFKHGEGTFIFPDGSKYEGNFVANKKHGFGKYYYVNGDSYEGEWRNDFRHGLGTYTYAASGSTYAGTWRFGKIDGYGDLIHSNHRYIGRWNKGAMLGKGKYVFQHGCQQWGEYIIAPKDEDGEEEDSPIVQAAGDEEEVEVVVKTRWIAGETTLITDDPVPPFDEGDIIIPTLPESPPPPETLDTENIENGELNPTTKRNTDLKILETEILEDRRLKTEDTLENTDDPELEPNHGGIAPQNTREDDAGTTESTTPINVDESGGENVDNSDPTEPQ